MWNLKSVAVGDSNEPFNPKRSRNRDRNTYPVINRTPHYGRTQTPLRAQTALAKKERQPNGLDLELLIQEDRDPLEGRGLSDQILFGELMQKGGATESGIGPRHQQDLRPGRGHRHQA